MTLATSNQFSVYNLNIKHPEQYASNKLLITNLIAQKQGKNSLKTLRKSLGKKCEANCIDKPICLLLDNIDTQTYTMRLYINI